jgi:hypothetical protein
MITTVAFLDTEVVPQPVEGVQAKLYQGTTFITAATTGPSGVLTWDLAVGNYDMVVSLPGRPGYSATNPYRLAVLGPPNTNSFQVSIELYQLPVADGDVFCRCSGFVYQLNGDRYNGVVRFYLDEVPQLFIDVPSGFPTAMLGDHVDCDIFRGYAEVNLIRGARYRVDIPGFRSTEWFVRIPERASAHLPDVLFPVPLSVDFTLTDLALAVGEVRVLYPSVTLRSGVVVSGADLEQADCWPVVFVIDSPEVVSVTARTNGSLEVAGIAAGEAVVTASRYVGDDTLLVRPAPGVSGELNVTVG